MLRLRPIPWLASGDGSKVGSLKPQKDVTRERTKETPLKQIFAGKDDAGRQG
jgi:hypothetical protein